MDHRYYYVYPHYSTSRYTSSTTGSTSGHTYHWSVAYTNVQYSSEFVQLMLTFGKTTSNQGWSGYSNNGSGLYTYNYQYNSYNSYSYLYNSGYNADEVTIRLFFAGNTSFNFNNTKMVNLVNAIIQGVDANFLNPTFNVGDTLTANVIDNNRFSVSNQGALINLTDSGSGFDSNNLMKFALSDVQGAADGSYAAESVGDEFITLNTPFLVEGNTEFLKADSADSSTIKTIGGHNFLSGTKVTYSHSSDSSLGGLANNSTYYVHAIDDEYLSLHANGQDAIVGINPIQLSSDSAGAAQLHSITTTSIAGRTSANGTVILRDGSKQVTGNQTLFKRFFKAGDTIFFKNDSSTPGRLDEHTIAVISDDENMELTAPANFSKSDAAHFVKTNIYAKPDGYSVHRPFDGGVEIGAGTAPLSQITRQTRKYFRYQSGKGIQNSFAINFNPPKIVRDLIKSTGTTAAINTQEAHNLRVGDTIVIEGAEVSIGTNTF